MKYQTKKQYAFASLLFRIFFDPLIAWGLASALAGSLTGLQWLGEPGYWHWVGIVLLIQTLWGTDTQHLIIEPYKSLTERLEEMGDKKR